MCASGFGGPNIDTLDEETRSLLKALRDESPAEREKAHDAIGTIGDPRVTQALVNILRDQGAVHNGVLIALTNLVGKGAMGPLVDALRDGNPGVRKYAEAALRGNVEFRRGGRVAEACRRNGLMRSTGLGEMVTEGFPLLVMMMLDRGEPEWFADDAGKWRQWWRQYSDELPPAPEWIGD